MSEEDIISQKRYGKIDSGTLFDSNISKTSKLLYAVLRVFAGGKDYCFPKIKLLAKAMSVSRQTIHVSLSELSAKKIIKIDSYFNKKTFAKQNRYVFFKSQEDFTCDSKDSLIESEKQDIVSKASVTSVSRRQDIVCKNSVTPIRKTNIGRQTRKINKGRQTPSEPPLNLFGGNLNFKSNKKSKELFVVNYYNKIFNKKIKLTSDREKKIKQVLKDFSVKEFLYAIHGLADKEINDWLKKQDGVKLEHKIGIKRLIDKDKRDDNLDNFSQFRFRKKIKKTETLSEAEKFEQDLMGAHRAN